MQRQLTHAAHDLDAQRVIAQALQHLGEERRRQHLVYYCPA